MTRIIDLDALVGEDKKVKLGGKTYTLPADLPADLYLEINRFAKDGKTEEEMFEALNERVLNLFRYRQPDLKSLPISLKQLMGAIGAIYGDDGEDEPAPRPPRAGTKSSRPSPKTRSQR